MGLGSAAPSRTGPLRRVRCRVGVFPAGGALWCRSPNARAAHSLQSCR